MSINSSRRLFTPFVCSMDGMLGREAKIIAKRLATKLANKWEKSYSQEVYVDTSMLDEASPWFAPRPV
jgi:hypothetical protein